MNRGIPIGLIVLGALLVIFALLQHVILRTHVVHLATYFLVPGVMLLAAGLALLVMSRKAAA